MNVTYDDQVGAAKRAVKVLAGQCDGAASYDDVGFNKYDARFGKELAETTREWTPRMVFTAARMVKKYGKQLARAGVDVAILYNDRGEVALVDHADASEKKIKEEAQAEARAEGAVDVEEVIKSLAWGTPREVCTRRGPRKVTDAPVTEGFWKAWRAVGAAGFAPFGISVAKFQGEWKITRWEVIAGKEGEPEEKRGAAPVPEVVIAEGVASKLLDYQVDAVKRIVGALQKYNGAVDGSDLGTGKTYVATAAAVTLGVRYGVVCPKAVIATWHRVGAHFGVKPEFVINYEAIKTGNTALGRWTKDARDHAIFEWSIDNGVLLIFDEAHKMKNRDTQNCKMGLAAMRQGFKVIAQSGTIAANPLEMRFVGELAALHHGKDFFGWVRHHGVVKGRFGMEFTGDVAVMKKLHHAIWPEHGSRLRVAEIPTFPECDTYAEAFDCNGESGEINKVYADMFAELAKIAEREDLSPAARSGHVLAVMTYARQRVEMLKVPAVVDMAEDYVEQGKSVVVFTCFMGTLRAIVDRLKAKKIAVGEVHGQQKGEERDVDVDAFQAERSHVIVVNIAAGGAGLSLHDLNGVRSRVAILMPSWSAIDLKQATGRVWRAGSKSKALQILFYAAGTIEDKVCERVREKIKRIDALNDGDLMVDGVEGFL